MNNWTVYTIEECCDILDSHRIPLNKEQREKIPGNIPYYGANGVQDYINDFIFDEDLILIAEDGGNFEQFATRPIAYRISGKSWVNNHAHVLRAKEGFDQGVIFYSLVHKNILSFIVGGTRTKLNQTELRSITLSLPPCQEQTQIAEVLSTIDCVIKQTEALIAKYRRIKTGLMHDLLTRGIDEKGNLRDPATHKFKTSPLGPIPQEWEVVRLERIADAIDPQPDHRAPPEVRDGEPYVGVGDFNPDGSINFESCRKVALEAVFKQQKRFQIEEGDVLFGKIGTIGVPRQLPHSVRYALNANTVIIKPKENAYFLFSCIRSPLVEDQIKLQTHLTSQPAFGIQKIRALLIPKPSEDEQRQIAEILEVQDNKIRSEETFLAKLLRLKTGLMQDLLTGKVSVSPLVGVGEPMSKLKPSD